MDNVSIAILTKVNELLERHGINPCEVVAAIHDAAHGTTRLSFEVHPPSGPQGDKFERLLTSLGLTPGTGELIGEDADIYSKLKAAIDRAPKPRPR